MNKMFVFCCSVILPTRKECRDSKMKLSGVFEKSKVIRGPHWAYPSKDGRIEFVLFSTFIPPAQERNVISIMPFSSPNSMFEHLLDHLIETILTSGQTQDLVKKLSNKCQLKLNLRILSGPLTFLYRLLQQGRHIGITVCCWGTSHFFCTILQNL